MRDARATNSISSQAQAINDESLIRGEEMHEELKWFASFPEELKKFRGKHIAIIGTEIVASGDNAIAILKDAKKKFPTKNPVLAFVPKEDALILPVI